MNRGSAVGVQPWNVKAIPARPASPTAAINIFAATGNPSDRPCSTFQFLGPRPNYFSLERTPAWLSNSRKIRRFSHRRQAVLIFQSPTRQLSYPEIGTVEGELYRGKGVRRSKQSIKTLTTRTSFLTLHAGRWPDPPWLHAALEPGWP